jgi:uncharacterized protein YkwD
MSHTPRRVLALITAVAGLTLAAPAGAQAADCANADAVPDGSNVTAVGQATLCLLNNERAAHGLAPLSEAAGLTAPSQAYSARMVRESFFAHVAPDGSSLTGRLIAAGYIARDGDWTVGENIAWGQGPLATPRSIMAAWMNSPGHRQNILTAEYEEIGVGIALGTPGDTTWGATYTTDFGTVERASTAVAGVTRRSARSARSRTRTAKATKRCSRTRTAAARGAKAAGRTAKGGRSKRVRSCAKAASTRAKKAAGRRSKR